MFETFENSFNEKNLDKGGATIKIIGIGGGGMNAVNKMVDDKIKGLDFVVVNTDRQALKSSKAPHKLVLGEAITKGLGAGANPEMGQKAANETVAEIKELVRDTDLVFIAAGMGGGTGTGAAPVIAKIAKESGSLVVGIVTTPFQFEGPKRTSNALKGLEELNKHVDSLIVVSNDRLLEELGEISITDSFQYSDAILKQAVRTITDLITEYSLINLDFADIKTVLANKGPALIGVGKGAGENSAVEAAIDAINSPILESSIDGAKNAIVNVAGSSKSLTIAKARTAIETIKEAAGSEVDVIFGVTINDALGDEVIVSVIATGIQGLKPGAFGSAPSKQSNTSFQQAKTMLDDETDIEKYKSRTTIEFNPRNLEQDYKKHTTVEAKTDDIFKGFSLLDDDDDLSSTADDNLDDLLK